MTMSNLPRPHPVYTCSERWIVRGIGLLVNGFFLLVLLLNLLDNDGIPAQFWLVAAFLMICVLGVFAALRWELIGGWIVIVGAVALVPANLWACWIAKQGGYGIASALIYSAPFFLVGSLFVASGRPTKR